MITRKAWRLCAVIPIVVASACGSDDDSDSTDATGGSASTAAGTSAPGSTAPGSTAPGSTVPGSTAPSTGSAPGSTSPGSTPTTGEASGDPIVLGLANMDTGAVAFPSAADTAEAAAEYINTELGGVQGRPLEFERCDVKNDEESSQACGQQFANNADMPAAVYTLAVNGGPFFAAMSSAGKPVLGGYGISPADNAPENTYFYYSGATFYYALADWIEGLGDVSSVAYFHGPDPASQGGADTLKGELPDVEFNEQIVAPGTADLTPLVSASGAADADLVIAFATPCGPLAQTFTDLGITDARVISLTSCVTPEEIKESPALYEGWTIANPSKVPTADATDEDSQLLLEKWETYGTGEPIGAFGEVGWGLTLTLKGILDELPEDQLTPDGIGEAIAGFTGPVVMGSESISCPGTDPAPATCADGVIFYEANAEGDLELVE